MLLVKTKIGPSEIHGIGLFADLFIPARTPTWEFSRMVDEAFTKEEAEALPEPKRSEILGLHFSYVSKQSGRYINCGDDARFVNHSDTPNIITTFRDDKEEDYSIAARNIQIGEEITNDYNSLCEEGVDFNESSST